MHPNHDESHRKTSNLPLIRDKFRKLTNILDLTQNIRSAYFDHVVKVLVLSVSMFILTSDPLDALMTRSEKNPSWNAGNM